MITCQERMKTPDKIKIVRFSDTAELSDYWVLENRTKNDDIEYIRKDVLLDWAKNMKRICKGAEPIEKAYQIMIDKIESL